MLHALIPCSNSYNAEGMSRRHVQNGTKIYKYFNILEFYDHIWNHLEKCIHISTNMLGIGSLICEIDVKISEK